MFYKLDKVKPTHILSLVFAVLLTTTGVTLGIVSINKSQEYRSLASGGEATTPAGCNQTCRANADCAVGLRCFYGTCRLADNPQDINCLPPQPTQTSPTNTPELTPSSTETSPVVGCNQVCQVNADCEVGLMCFQGHCRLVDKPETDNCLLNQPTPNITSSQATDSTQPSQPPNTGLEETSSKTFIDYFLSGLEQIRDFVIYVFTTPQYRLPAFTFLAGFILIIIALLLRHKQTKPTKKTPHLTTTKKTQKSPTSSTMTKRLEQKKVKPPK